MSTASSESTLERIADASMLVIFWAAFASLATGLWLWVMRHDSESGALLLTGGLLGLMVLPTLRLVAAIATATRERDWLTLWSTLAVLALLGALTLRDAATP